MKAAQKRIYHKGLISVDLSTGWQHGRALCFKLGFMQKSDAQSQKLDHLTCHVYTHA